MTATQTQNETTTARKKVGRVKQGEQVAQRLTDLRIRKARHGMTDDRGNVIKQLTDGRSLFLRLMPNGLHSWGLDYTRPGVLNAQGKPKRNTLNLGTYPDVSLELAREKAQEAREQVARGIDPADLKNEEKRKAAAAAAQAKQDADRAAENVKRVARGERPVPKAGSVEAVALAVAAARVGAKRWGPRAEGEFLEVLGRHVFPYTGDRHISTFTVAECRELWGRVHRAGKVPTGNFVIKYMKWIFASAIASGLCEVNHAAGVKDEDTQPHEATPYAAITDPTKIGPLMNAIDGYGGHLTSKALRLGMLTWQRPWNIETAQWAHFDLDGKTYGFAAWIIPSAEMKRKVLAKLNGHPHVVPLARQTVAMLRELHKLTGHGQYVFPGAEYGESGHLSSTAIHTALTTIGYGPESENPHTLHGCRAMAMTIMAELHDVNEKIVDAHLAHVQKTVGNGKSYARMTWLPQRVEIAQQWADWVDQVSGANVVELRAA